MFKGINSVPKTLLPHLLKIADKIESFDDDRQWGDGYWLYLNRGFIFDHETHLIHADTVAEMIRDIKRITVCTCDDCQHNNGSWS